MMGFLDSFGDFAQGAIDTHLSQLEKQARDKHELAMADKAMEQRTTDQWMQDRQQRKMGKMQGEFSAAEADARRKAARDEKDEARKWDREKLTATEAGRDRRAALSANRTGATAQPKPARMEFQKVPKYNADGEVIGEDILGLDPITGEQKTLNGKPIKAGPAYKSPDDFLSRY